MRAAGKGEPEAIADLNTYSKCCPEEAIKIIEGRAEGEMPPVGQVLEVHVVYHQSQGYTAELLFYEATGELVVIPSPD